MDKNLKNLLAPHTPPTKEVNVGGRDVEVVEERQGKPQIELINPREIELDEHINIRRFMPDVEELAHNIEVRGQDQPIIINHQNKVVAGVRRLLAFRHINERRSRMGMKPLLIECIRRELSGPEAIMFNISSNLQHRALSDMDIAYVIDKLENEYRMTDTKIGAIFGRTQPWVNQQKHLLALPRTLQEQVHKKLLHKNTAIALAMVPDQPRHQFLQKMEMEGRKVTANAVKKLVLEMKPRHQSVLATDTDEYRRSAKSLTDLREMLERNSDRKFDPLACIFRAQSMWLVGMLDEKHLLEECHKQMERFKTYKPQMAGAA